MELIKGANQKGVGMPGKNKLKPGETVDRSGIYESDITNQKTTLDKGATAPPTKQAGEHWKLKIETNPKKK